MRFDAKYKPEMVASADKDRHAITTPVLEGKNIVATDGRRLIAVPIERDDGDVDGPIPGAVLEAARKAGKALGCHAVLAREKELEVVLGGGKFPRPERTQFPDWTQLVPGKDRPEIVLSIDPELLCGLARAMGAYGKGALITLRIAVDVVDGKAKALVQVVQVEASGFTGVALIMPRRAG